MRETIGKIRGPFVDEVERVSFEVNGPALEVGGGIEVGVGSRVFLRPEVWLLMMGGERSLVDPQPSQPAASCLPCAVIALRMNMATVTGPTPPGTGVTQLATSFTLSVSTSPTITVSPFGPVI